jgi:hypothetical protein
MNSIKLAAIALIAAGVLALMYGGITYTKESHEAKVGPFEFSVEDKETINFPVWVGVAAIAGGAALLVIRGAK